MAEAAVTRLLALCNRTKRMPQNTAEEPASFLASEKKSPVGKRQAAHPDVGCAAKLKIYSVIISLMERGLAIHPLIIL
jgi:hypothetical protein